MFTEIAKKYEKKSIFISILIMILAIFLIFYPLQSINLIVKLLGTIIILEGLLNIISYFRTKDELRLMHFGLIEGLFEILFGIIFMSMTWLFPILLCVFIIAKSIIKLQFAFSLKSVNGYNWIGVIVISILTLICGIFAIFNPFSITSAVATAFGIVLFIYSLLNLVEAIYFSFKFKE